MFTLISKYFCLKDKPKDRHIIFQKIIKTTCGSICECPLKLSQLNSMYSLKTNSGTLWGSKYLTSKIQIHLNTGLISVWNSRAIQKQYPLMDIFGWPFKIWKKNVWKPDWSPFERSKVNHFFHIWPLKYVGRYNPKARQMCFFFD